MRAARFLFILLTAALLLLRTAPLRATEDAPIRVKATVDAKDVALTGRFSLRLEHTPTEDVTRPYSVQVVLSADSRNLVTLNHAPPTPTLSWKKGAVIAYDIPVAFPFDADLEVNLILAAAPCSGIPPKARFARRMFWVSLCCPTQPSRFRMPANLCNHRSRFSGKSAPGMQRSSLRPGALRPPGPWAS